MLDAVVLALLWLTVVLRTPSLVRGPAPRAVWLVFLGLALAKTIVFAPVTEVITSVSERPDLITLIHHLLGVVCAVAVLRFVTLVTGMDDVRPRAPRQVRITGLVVAVVLTLLFGVSDEGIEVDLDVLLASPTMSAPTVLYWLVLEVYLGGALAVATLLFWRTANRSTARLLRIGLRLIALGTLLNTGYAVVKIVFILVHAAGKALPLRSAAGVLDIVLTLVPTLIVVGGALPGSALAWRIVRAHRTIAALSPLWRLMRSLFPDIVLPYRQDRRWPLVDHGELRLLLYRRIIEIRDGILQLGNFVPAGAGEDALRFVRAAGAAEADESALAEACRIELGVRRMRAGEPAGAGRDEPVGGGASIEEESEWLSRVSRAAAHSPLPARFAEWWEREHLHPATPVHGG
ncbi:MAB_1171c family putative transporter [Micromonospora sp. DT233]|uniref:MAB_1171c family putative transporter n=1 Tax=Micromonospora sp. DT233 TaxID=3393432 RepID=UPI003CF496CC